MVCACLVSVECSLARSLHTYLLSHKMPYNNQRRFLSRPDRLYMHGHEYKTPCMQLGEANVGPNVRLEKISTELPVHECARLIAWPLATSGGMRWGWGGEISSIADNLDEQALVLFTGGNRPSP